MDDPLPIKVEDRVLDMHSRLTYATISLRYKFANGYLLKESSRLAPFVYLGAGYNYIFDQWGNHNRVNRGSYASINGGLGLAVQITPILNCSYTLGFGYLTSDRVDYIQKGVSDMYMQNSLSVGFSF